MAGQERNRKEMTIKRAREEVKYIWNALEKMKPIS